MPDLQWNVTDFVEGLEVLPQIEEYGTSHFFEVSKDGLRLEISIWQHESMIYLDLYRNGIEKPIMGFALFVRDGVRLVKEKAVEFLQIRNCLPAPSGSSYLDFEDHLQNVGSNKYGLTVRVHVKPHIRVEFEK